MVSTTPAAHYRVALYHDGSSDHVTTPATGGTTIGRQLVNNWARGLLLDGHRRLEAVHQLHEKEEIS